jgi:hypothetical protein
MPAPPAPATQPPSKDVVVVKPKPRGGIMGAQIVKMMMKYEEWKAKRALKKKI